MRIKSKIISAIVEHPKLVMFGIGLAITVAVGTAIGLTSPEQVFAPGGTCGTCHIQ